VHFVELYRGLSFEAALGEINGHFHLWPCADDPERKLAYSDRLKALFAADNRKASVRTDEIHLHQLNRLAAEITRLRKNKAKYAPKHRDGAFDDRYVEACAVLNIKEYQFDCLYTEAQEVRSKKNDQ